MDRAVKDGWKFVAIAPPVGPLAEALSERKVERVSLILRDAQDRRLPREEACRNILAAVVQAEPQLLHANSLSMGRLTGAVADRLSIPCVAHLRDILKVSGAAIADLNCNQRLIAVSHATRDFHVTRGLAASRTSVAYNGVDCNEYQPRIATGELKRDLGLEGSCRLAVTIGQIGLRKGQDVLATAAIRVHSVVPDLHYLLVGERNSSKQESIEFERSVAERFEHAGIGDRLYRVGYRNDVPRIMNECDLLIHPAQQEPLGRVLLEAAASGLPIIATNVGGTAEVLQDDVSARLIQPNTPDELGTAICEFYRGEPLRQRLAEAARERVLAHFNVDLATQRMCEIWQEVAGTP